MDLKTIENLLNLIAKSEVNEVSIEEGDFKIKVKKKAAIEQAPVPVQYQMPAQPGQASPQPAVQQQPPQQPATPAEAASEGEPTEDPPGEIVKSPIVGTFYRASSPDDDPYVSVGDSVGQGQTICIIEAMKIMNEIESDFSGEIKKILVENAEPVEYDQPLFIIG